MGGMDIYKQMHRGMDVETPLGWLIDRNGHRPQQTTYEFTCLGDSQRAKQHPYFFSYGILLQFIFNKTFAPGESHTHIPFLLNYESFSYFKRVQALKRFVPIFLHDDPGIEKDVQSIILTFIDKLTQVNPGLKKTLLHIANSWNLIS